MKATLFLLLVCLLFSTKPTHGQELSVVANRFLNSLSKEARQKCHYAFQDEERFNWHFVPRARNGVTLHDLSESQRQAAFELLKASLSQQGYKKATGIIGLEDILREVEGRSAGDNYRDRLNYYFTIFGTPSTKSAWGWRLEGHHVSLNFSSVDGLVESATPSFFGSNPAIVPSGKEKGKQILKDETELGFSLLNSLSADQLKTALVSERAPYDIMTGNNRTAHALKPVGILYTALNDAQKKLFMQLLKVYVDNYAFGFSSKLMAKIEQAGIHQLSFAWAGSLKPGAGHYYRIQGPMLLIEYDNTQNNANHVHTVVRDLTNDFAEDILREHYEKEHTKP